ncbi:MAG: hypothetical protein AVDCRST_MAG25-3512 [uncultured Rubrobacteraceae bacterium]|uniref:Uncharacterized protein n=1 Tax=uncultured Rubrobacteraceae bacterium TaxID=349277 RepID=A0A6J4SGX6_9ACTN|nr:MAG: hypothetical protein AVDCRST_MAG25-3512 [uncultured Rubrobacteraceae bacterium]
MDYRSNISSTTGGVMTDEAGAVTGELEVRTVAEAGLLEVSVRYAGAEEWYTVSGSPVPLSGKEKDPMGLHGRVVARLSSPGTVVDGNEEPASLHGLDRL